MGDSCAVLRKYVTTLGDGEHHAFTVHHNLDSEWVLIHVYDKDSGQIMAPAMTSCLDPNTVLVDFGVYFCLYERPHWGPFALPWTTTRIGVRPGSIPAKNSLGVVIVG